MSLFNIPPRHPPRFLGHTWTRGRINDRSARAGYRRCCTSRARPATHTRTPAGTRGGRVRRRRGREEYTRRNTRARDTPRRTRAISQRAKNAASASCGSFARSAARSPPPRASGFQREETPSGSEPPSQGDRSSEFDRALVRERRRESEPEGKPEFGNNGIREA